MLGTLQVTPAKFNSFAIRFEFELGAFILSSLSLFTTTTAAAAAVAKSLKYFAESMLFLLVFAFVAILVKLLLIMFRERWFFWNF